VPASRLSSDTGLLAVARIFGIAGCLIIISVAPIACATTEEAAPAEVDAPAGDPERGRALYLADMGCNVCHGQDATGSVGPNIRQTTIEKVYHALQNFPDMMNWQFNYPELFEAQSLLDIVAYLQTLEKQSTE
jgi:mono/diheme cytochrome c family protein